MKIGMLWFDNDPHTPLAAKVEKAAAYYLTKYGRTPTVCFVHPSMLPAAQEAESEETVTTQAAKKTRSKKEKAQPASTGISAVGVEVRTNPSVRPNHFWIGVNGASPVNSTTSTSRDRSAGISPDLTLSSASSSR
jgi:hypothetical protein